MYCCCVFYIQAQLQADSADNQISCLRTFLQAGKGDLVSGIYMRIAEILDSLGEKKQALAILKTGIDKVTEQKYKLELEEMLR